MGFLAAGFVLATGAVWGGRLIIDPAPISDGSAALIAISVVVGAATAALGLVLSRGRWARRVSIGVLAVQLGLTVLLDPAPIGWAALAVTGVALILVAGPWLDGFLRLLPPADPPPLPAVVLALAFVALPGLLGIAAPGGVGAGHWLAALVALATGWAFSRALSVGLWSARLAVPALLVVAALDSPPGGAVVLVAGAVGMAALAWSAPVRRAIHPLVPRADGVAVPPQLVPSDLLEQAGYDERGRPLPPKR